METGGLTAPDWSWDCNQPRKMLEFALEDGKDHAAESLLYDQICPTPTFTQDKGQNNHTCWTKT